MSYEKLNTLIDQAPAVSQWWTSNKRALNWWLIGYTAVVFSVLMMTLLSVAATLVWSGMWLSGEVPAEKYWMLIAAPLVSLCGMGVIKFFHKISPKRFTYEGFTLTRSANAESVSLAFTHKVLSKAVKINDPQMKPILARLSAIKDMNLPACWWEALWNELDNLTPKVLTVEKSIEEKIDAVYVQIEDVAASPMPPKVLRL